MAAIINEINPITFEIQTYTPQDLASIPSELVDSDWGNDGSKGEYTECTIVSSDGLFQITDQNFQGLIPAGYTSADGVTYKVEVDPEKTLRSKGFSGGSFNIIYRFLRNELSSSSDNRSYLLKEISPDRTEVRLVNNFIGNDDLLNLLTNFKNRPNKGYFQDFYLNFGSNVLAIANNIILDNTKAKYELLVNLYEPLPSQIQLREPLWIVTQPADPLAFNVQFQPEVVIPKVFNPTIKSANFNVPIKDRTNNSTQPISYGQLITSSLASSYQQINSYLAEKGINISIDYSNFENFVHFSSAESRINNFVYKVQLIEKYEDDIATLESTPRTTPLVESNILYLNNKIDDIIKNFDGFEYYLYFESGSITFPKSTSTPPYILQSFYPTATAEVRNWYSRLKASASIYDENNKDYLVNTIPDYLREDPQNDPYKVFVDMMGQQYDNIWIYYKDVSNRYNGDNRLNYGISKDLVADAIRSFGLNVYQNNFSSVDLFNAFLGYNPDNKLREANPPGVIDYRYVSQESLNLPLDDVNKEMYKRIYHNLPYLLKSKGTVAGLQNIISMFGIPNTVLTIREFGGVYSRSNSPVASGSVLISGIKDIVLDNMEIYPSLEIDDTNKVYSTMVPIVTLDGNNTYKPLVLSTVKSIFQEPWYNNEDKRSLAPSANTIEIAFSPQNDVDNSIRFSGFDLGSRIANPNYDFNGYAPYYPSLISLALARLSNNEYNLSNYLNVIKQFDNSLFLMIKDFVPAKTNLKSGIVIKQHLLNRSKHDAPRAYVDSSSYTGTYTPSETVEGGTGGSFDPFNTLTNPSNSQFWYEQIPTPLGYTSSYHRDQSEFYNGELPNSSFVATTGEGNPDNTSKLPGSGRFNYSVNVLFTDSASFLAGGIGPGLIVMWYDESELTFTAPNILLGPGATPTLGVTSTPVVKPTVALPPLADTTDKDGSSGGGSGGGLGIGGSGRTDTNERLRL